MNSRDFIKNLVSNKIYSRGINYYEMGRVLQYRIYNPEPNNYLITAVVSGSEKYNVDTKIILKKDKIELDSSCDCPYDWEEYCKHEVAVLKKFMEEDYRSNKVNYEPQKIEEEEVSASQKIEKRIADRSFNSLLEISKNYDESEMPRLDYTVKGLINQNLKNFKLFFDSNYLSQYELEELIASLNGDHAYDYSNQNFIKKHFYGIEEELLTELLKLNKSKGRGSSLLLTKNEENLDFLLKLSENFELLMTENNAQAKKGKTLHPKLKLSGDLEEIELKLMEKDYPIYQSKNFDSNCRWTVIDNVIHKLDFYNFDELPTSFMVPEDKRGKLLFEIIPNLERSIDLEREDNLKGFELIKESPDIDLKLDYKKDKISAELEVEFAGESYENSELLGLDSEKNLLLMDLLIFRKTGMLSAVIALMRLKLKR